MVVNLYDKRRGQIITLTLETPRTMPLPSVSGPERRTRTQQQGHQTQEVSPVEADERTAAALGIEAGAPVYERARVMTRDGAPTHTMTSYYRAADVEGTPLVDPTPGIAGRGGGFQVLTEQGLPPHEIAEELTARMPTAEETLLLSRTEEPFT